MFELRCNWLRESLSNDRADRGQQPLSFLRQLLAGCLCPALLDGGTLAPDAIEQARAVLKRCPEGMGAYSSSKGKPHDPSLLMPGVRHKHSHVMI